MELSGKRIALGVTGGIAAYKAADLVRQLIKQGATVKVAMTESATHFVTPVTFQALSGNTVYVEQWDHRVSNNMAHIQFSREADVLLIAPATANFVAKVANGLADDLLSSLTLARTCPLAMAPAMNMQMWENAATQRNVKQLKEDGVTIFGPARGEQACGDLGYGRMLEPREIVEDLIAFFQPKHLAGKKILITAGPTFEAIDPVRGITNLSTGKMGFAIARAAREAGAEVTLLCGPVSQQTPRGVARINVTSALEMHSAAMQLAPSQDAFVGVAAVADYRPATTADQKIKKDGNAPAPIELIQNPDILAEVAALSNAPLCVGFAAESQNLSEYAQKKRQSKKIPLIVGNLVQNGFGGDTNTMVLFDDQGETPLPSGQKIDLARTLVEKIGQMLKAR